MEATHENIMTQVILADTCNYTKEDIDDLLSGLSPYERILFWRYQERYRRYSRRVTEREYYRLVALDVYYLFERKARLLEIERERRRLDRIVKSRGYIPPLRRSRQLSTRLGTVELQLDEDGRMLVVYIG